MRAHFIETYREITGPYLEFFEQGGSIDIVSCISGGQR